MRYPFRAQTRLRLSLAAIGLGLVLIAIAFLTANYLRTESDVRAELDNLRHLEVATSAIFVLSSHAADHVASGMAMEDGSMPHGHAMADTVADHAALVDAAGSFQDAIRSLSTDSQLTSMASRLGSTFVSYVDSIHALESLPPGTEPMAHYHEVTQAIEEAVRAELAELRVAIHQRLDESAERAEAAATLLLWIVPVLFLFGTGALVALVRRQRESRQLREMERLHHAKDQVIAGVSHELRTPLTGIVGISAELETSWRDMDPEEVDGLVQILASESAEMADLIEDLLVGARLDADALTVRRQDVELGPLLRSLGEPFRAEVEFADDAWEGTVALADPLRVRQIVRNLLTNARRYGGPNVVIRLGDRDGSLSVKVIDDGPGVPEEDRQYIFEPYGRSAVAEGQPASIGLGLTVSRKLALLMGGNLTYQFADGLSIFELTLPRAEPAESDLAFQDPARQAL